MQKAIAGLQFNASVRCQHAHQRRAVKVQAAAATEVKAGVAAKRKQLGDSDLQVSRKCQRPFRTLHRILSSSCCGCPTTQ